MNKPQILITAVMLGIQVLAQQTGAYSQGKYSSPNGTITVGMKLDLKDPAVRRRFKMSNFCADPESRGAIGFEYVSDNQNALQMPPGSEYVESAVVENGIVVSTEMAARIYYNTNAEAGEACMRAASVFATGLQLERLVIGNSRPKELMKSKSLQIAETLLGKDATDEEKAKEALKVSARLGLDFDIAVVMQTGSYINRHAITLGKNNQGKTFVAATRMTMTVDTLRNNNGKRSR